MLSLAFIAAALAAVSTRADEAVGGDPAAAAPSKFRDPEDGRFDVSGFLDTAHGFLPLVVPITEPALGYGAVGAAVFIADRKDQGESFVRPNIATVGALRTDNGTRGWFGAHLGTWWDGRLRTNVAFADIDLNLDFFGLAGDRVDGGGDGLGYSIKARGGVAGASYRLGGTQLWVGLRYASVHTTVTLDPPTQDLQSVPAADYNLRLGAVTPSITFDRRDNFFTPIRGWYVDLSVPVFRESLGSDRDFETANLTAIYYHPFGQSLYFSVRGTGKDSTADTPFFLRPYVALRGVEALRYQGERVAEIEAEIRWQLPSRFSVVGFAGTGSARSSLAMDRAQSVTAGGAGFRYLVARRYGLQMGIDVATSAEDTAFYFVFGHAWLRP
jgi:hypothetical protein